MKLRSHNATTHHRAYSDNFYLLFQLSYFSFAEDAEALCRQHLDKSIELDNKNAEALQMLASFYLSKEDTQVNSCDLVTLSLA